MKSKFLKLLIKMFKYHSIYIWGAQGELVENLTNDDIRKMETSDSNVERVLDFINMLKVYNLLRDVTRAFDCSGLICWALSQVGREMPGFDITADALFSRYPKTTKLKKGVLVHRKGHIGCYIGYNHVIEAKGRDWGVVITPFKRDEWDKNFADPWAS